MPFLYPESFLVFDNIAGVFELKFSVKPSVQKITVTKSCMCLACMRNSHRWNWSNEVLLSSFVYSKIAVKKVNNWKRYFSVIHDILCVNSNLKLLIIFGLLLFWYHWLKLVYYWKELEKRIKSKEFGKIWLNTVTSEKKKNGMLP